MQRRRFLKLFAAGATGLVAPIGANAVTQGATVVSCPVAGVSFNGYDVSKLREHEPVIVRCETYNGEHCYRILDLNETTIGFVPRKKLPLFANKEVRQAWLSKVNPYAVPWKQLEIAASLFSSI
jgi:hypothetical protein